MIYWNEKLDDFGQRLISAIGADPSWLPTDHNPIVRALQSGDFVEKYSHLKGFNKSAVSRAVTVCQMTFFDQYGGPEGDNERKALRRHWYTWYKTTFAQPFSEQLGEDLQSERWGINWSALLSTTYAYFVDNKNVTYHDLWVKDASRMIESFYGSLFRGLNVIICVEKDSLFEDFTAAARAIGARAVYSGKGKTSKAATEKLLQDAFGWYPESEDPFSYDSPLRVLTISDFDFDGHMVIDPTFGEQLRRYTNHVIESRVGIMPENHSDWDLAVKNRDAYKVKLKNSGYLAWAAKHALFAYHCEACEHDFIAQGADYGGDGDNYHYTLAVCPGCSTVAGGQQVTKDTIAYGFEVESLHTREYYRLIVDALLRVLDFETIVRRLREECIASASQAVEPIVQVVLARNESYQETLRKLAEFDKLREIKQDFERQAQQELEQFTRRHKGDFEHIEDDPDTEEFVEYVEDASAYTNAWRPFSEEKRTVRLQALTLVRQAQTIKSLINENILTGTD